jgi:methyl-accepting chemotaxis protein
MARHFNNVSITTKMAVAFGLLLTVVLLSGVLILGELQALADEQMRAQGALRGATIAAGLRSDIEEARGSVRAYLLTGSDPERRRAVASLEAYDRDVDRLARLLSTENPGLGKRVAARIPVIAQALTPGLEAELNLGTTMAGRTAAVALVGSAASDRHRQSIDTVLSSIWQDVAAWSKALDERATTARRQTELLMASDIVVTTLLIALIAFYVVTAICAPLRSAILALQGLADGNLLVETPATDRRDEVGQIAKAIHRFRVAATEKLEIERKAQEAWAVADRLQRGRSEEAARISADQQDVLSRIGKGFDRIARGDLRTTLQDPFPSEYDAIRLGLNQVILKLRGAISEVAASSGALKDSANALHADAELLTQRSDAQASQLRAGAEALSAVTGLVQQSAQFAEAARNLAARTETDALRSGDIIRRANATMFAIDDFIGRIGHIAAKINEISTKTDLLALNARVQVARLDEHRGGAGVIAVEIRSLASQAGASASEINTIIGRSDALMRDGRALAEDVSMTLEAISRQIAALHEQSEKIARASGEQADGLVEINRTIGEVDMLARENRIMAQRAQRATFDLAGEGARLTAMVGRFQLRAPGEAAQA